MARSWKQRKQQQLQRIRLRKLELPMVQPTSLPCDGCTACCQVVGVEELNKDIWCRCPHQTDTGCGIYPDRPTECKDYWCAECESEECSCETDEPTCT